MGLIKHLLFWPVTGPKALVEFSLGQVEKVAHRELTDDALIKEDLMALQMELELGDIDIAEYEAREAELMDRLREAREWRTELGMEEEWAPLEFARSEDDDARPSSAEERGESEPWPKDWSPTSPPDSSSS